MLGGLSLARHDSCTFEHSLDALIPEWDMEGKKTGEPELDNMEFIPFFLLQNSTPLSSRFPSFGSPAISILLTRGFASPPHNGFAFFGREFGMTCFSARVYRNLHRILEFLFRISQSHMAVTSPFDATESLCHILSQQGSLSSQG